MQGSTVMRQSGAATLATEEPDAFMAHVRVWGGGRLGNHWLYPEADAFQPPLVPRVRFQARLRPGVRGAADKAAHLMGCKSPYRQLPDSDG